MLVPLAKAGDQVPPRSGAPKSNDVKSTGLSVEHKSIELSIPAFAAELIITVTFALTPGQEFNDGML